MERSLWILFAALVTIEVLTFGSKGFPADASPLARGIHPVAASRVTYLQISGREFLAQGRNAHYHSAQEENVDGLARNPWRNEDEERKRRNLRPRSSGRLRQTIPSAEVEVLMAFKAGITSDPLGALASWSANDSESCQWIGVTCSRVSNRVIALQLDNLLLTGTISPLLGTLTFLRHLNLSANFFHGSIPTALLNCSHLTYLALRDNDLSGTLPSQVGDLQNLLCLDLSNNFLLGGNLSASVGNCSYLRILHLDYTAIGGEIPSTLGQLAELQRLNISMTLFTGTIPKSLGNCSALIFLDMGNAYAVTGMPLGSDGSSVPASVYLSGELPEELGQLTNLLGFGLWGANIVGSFPSWIANLTSFKQIVFLSCFLTGEIPEFLGMLPSLEVLLLTETSIIGAIPKAISNCSNLWFLEIEFNPHMTGVIPSELGLLWKLGSLCLDNNNLIGTIPSSISNCSRLRVINFGGNPSFDPQPAPSWVTSLVNLTMMECSGANLVGEIPVTWGEISKLDWLVLSFNNLSGGIPATIGNCTSLFHFDFSQNQFTGEIPSEIWNFQRLSWFSVSGNFLTGSIPKSIGNWSQVNMFDISLNVFSGEVPFKLGLLQNLQYAYFDSNNLSASIPVTVGNCSALIALHLYQNHLTGSIPSSIGNLTLLQEFKIEENLLEGKIPIDLMRCTQLVDLEMSRNLLVGNVPEEIGQLVLLQSFGLGHNQLSGNFPYSAGFCQGLLSLDISSNKFSGSIPGGAIANLSRSLIALNVSQNFLTGVLPEELGDLTDATYLNFSGNHFSGSIPSALGRCEALETLDLSMNNLSGGIPRALGALQFLVFVDMSNNDLEGPLPNGGIFNSSNLSSAWFLGNPGLCGSVLLKDCAADLSPVNASKCTGFHCKRAGVVATSIGAVVGLMILGVIAYKIVSKCFPHSGFSQRGLSEHTQLNSFVMGLTLSKEELIRISTVPENIIGVGDRSKVYKEVLPGGKAIAIKMVTLGKVEHDGYQVARAELHRAEQNLSNIRHRNVVKVLGLMSSQDFIALFLEYMPNGSLHKQLHEVQECALSWETRLKIAMGVAEGLFYLHRQAHEPVIHRDLKPGNILLDEDMVPKLADFGISKYVSPKNKDRGETTVSRLCGTMGYIPPEYGVSTRVSTKGDVYSYGVVLLELLTRKQPFVADVNCNERGQQSGTHIVDWILEFGQSIPEAVLDSMLLGNNNTSGDNSISEANERKQMMLLLHVGLLCTQTRPDSRPGMGDVLGMLKQIQETGSDLPRDPTPSLEELANEVSGGTKNEEAPSTCVSS